MKQQDLSFIDSGSAKWNNHFGIWFSSFSTELNITLSYDSAITPLPIYLIDLKTRVHTKAWIQMFIEAVFIITQN